MAVPDSNSSIPDELPGEELAPAAVKLDVSHTSPLIQVLYQATRETKERPTLGRLAEAKRLITNNAQIKAVDAQGRTALHWAVFGSSYTSNPKVLVAYEEIANELIERGVEINREDTYNSTALDYLLYSPNFEMQTLMMEHGASSGFLPAVFPSFRSAEAKPQARAAGVSMPVLATLHLEKPSTLGLSSCLQPIALVREIPLKPL
jgi:ankyrin repeat protein